MSSIGHKEIEQNEDDTSSNVLSYGYGTIHLLTIVLIVLLALAMLCQHFMSFKRARTVLPLLKLTSSGPFSTTRVNQNGIILPKIAYNNQEVYKLRHQHQMHRTTSVEVLNPAELLTINTFSEENAKIIDEEPAEDKESAEYTRGDLTIATVEGLLNDESQDTSILIPSPLSPAYHPGRLVTQVWDGRHQVDSLYRYKSFDRLVYPPGYVT